MLLDLVALCLLIQGRRLVRTPPQPPTGRPTRFEQIRFFGEGWEGVMETGGNRLLFNAISWMPPLSETWTHNNSRGLVSMIDRPCWHFTWRTTLLNVVLIPSETTEAYWDRHWIQTTITFCLINGSGCSTYSSVHCRRQSVSCCSRSSMEGQQSFIARHCRPSLSIFCCRLKSHLFSLSYPSFWLLSSVQCPRSDSSFWTL